MDNDGILEELRHHYAIIYKWHKERGVKTLKVKHKDRQIDDIKRFGKYVDFVKNMPRPEEANKEIIGAVAGEVLGGCMEWSYWEEVEPNQPLNSVAHHIRTLLERAEQAQETQKQEKVLRRLRNIWQSGDAQPMAEEIKVPRQELTVEKYFEYARVAYSDLAEHTRMENIGGHVVLADTNLEHEQKSDWGRPGILNLKFRNAKAMHFRESKGEDSIVVLAKVGTISILSVTIGD